MISNRCSADWRQGRHREDDRITQRGEMSSLRARTSLDAGERGDLLLDRAVRAAITAARGGAGRRLAGVTCSTNASA
jgi:hypothetical protein